uniref:Uncharacterized protein n=1 Tax=Parascaris equorum TaxID=6256 RepID=A0A914RPN1_PAREQ
MQAFNDFFSQYDAVFIADHFFPHFIRPIGSIERG